MLGIDDATEDESDCSEEALIEDVTEVLVLRCEIAPIAVVALIRVLVTWTSDRTENVDEPRGLWLSTVGLFGWVSVPLAR